MTSARARIAALCCFLGMMLCVATAIYAATQAEAETAQTAADNASNTSTSRWSDALTAKNDAETDCTAAATIYNGLPPAGMRNANQIAAAQAYNDGMNEMSAANALYNSAVANVEDGNNFYGPVTTTLTGEWWYDAGLDGGFGMFTAGMCFSNAITKYNSAKGCYDSASGKFEDTVNNNTVFYYGRAENYFETVISLYNGGNW